MMEYVAEIKDGTVVRVVVCPQGTGHPDNWKVVGPNNTVGIGWTYDEQEGFQPPHYEEETE